MSKKGVFRHKQTVCGKSLLSGPCMGMGFVYSQEKSAQQESPDGFYSRPGVYVKHTED